MAVSETDRPRIVVTVQSPERAKDEEVAWRKNDRYFEGVQRAGGDPIPLDETSSAEARQRAFAAMDGLLLSGGADLDPALYDQAAHPTTVVEPGRDALELEAWRAARDRNLPVLGICRGFQAINVFSGGSLLQDLDGHTSPAYPAPEAHSHPMSLDPECRLARILGADEAAAELEVNTYHHQAVRPSDLAPGLRAAGVSPHHDEELVEAIEAAEPDTWIVGVQSHPERTEFTPAIFERLWAAFIAAAAERRGRVSRAQ
ncbi:MAG TPA: gamma-glutamyl-gamma-aminobutyrate hydrolase family protein [Candidatus Binatia bacterium]|nr:gamma-glutamyl-gamma-aminobutyrate hydrolase family protein [Candidatus Binatia bacterium]